VKCTREPSSYSVPGTRPTRESSRYSNYSNYSYTARVLSTRAPANLAVTVTQKPLMFSETGHVLKYSKKNPAFTAKKTLLLQQKKPCFYGKKTPLFYNP
jgi:hypothetical protein